MSSDPQQQQQQQPSRSASPQTVSSKTESSCSPATPSSRTITTKAETRDIKLCLYQILTLQSGLYLVMSCLVVVLYVPFGELIGLDSLLLDTSLSPHSVRANLTIAAHVLTVVPMCLLVAHTLKVSTMCMDFVLTMYLAHFMICSVVARVPRTSEWWCVNIINGIVVTVASELLCNRMDRQALQSITNTIEMV
eukprot:PhM_4_TR8740/c0_g1_i1/m.45837/K20318/SYS1; protein SYS1